MNPIETPKQYSDYVDKKSPNSPILKNCFKCKKEGSATAVIPQAQNIIGTHAVIAAKHQQVADGKLGCPALVASVHGLRRAQKGGDFFLCFVVVFSQISDTSDANCIHGKMPLPGKWKNGNAYGACASADATCIIQQNTSHVHLLVNKCTKI